MEKKRLTLAAIKQALEETQYPSVWKKAQSMPDEEFCKMNFRDDFDMDSLDIIELTLCLDRNNGVCIPEKAVSEFSRRGGTVQAMLDAYNQNF